MHIKKNIKKNIKIKRTIKRTIKGQGIKGPGIKGVRKSSIYNNHLHLPTKLSNIIKSLSKYSNKSDSINTNTEININNLISLKPNKNTKYLIANSLENTADTITYKNIEEQFSKYFVLDYNNYIKNNNNTKKQLLKFNGIQKQFEGYLLITVYNNEFRSYMYNNLFIVDNSLNNDVFPEHSPDNLKNNSNEFAIKFLIINNIYTIMKYLSIILGHNIRKNDNYECGFEIIRVRFNVYDDFSVNLERCNVKKNWNNTYIDNLIYAWINVLLIEPLFIKDYKKLDLGLRTKILYYIHYQKYKIALPIQINLKHMTKKDFSNNYIMFQSQSEAHIVNDITYLEKHLEKYKLKQLDLYSSLGTHISFAWLSDLGVIDLQQLKHHYNTPTFLANVLDNYFEVSEKHKLYFNFKKLFPNECKDFLSESIILTSDYKYKKGEMLVAKPINQLFIKRKRAQAFGGKDIVFINNEKALNEAKLLLPKYDYVLLSKYITNPLLFKQLKFHLRLCFIPTIIDGKLKTYLLDIARIVTAKLPFKLEDFENKDIHDTHLKSTYKDFYFPQDFTTENMGIPITQKIIDKIWTDIRNIMTKVSIILDNSGISTFANNKHGFLIFGPDIMITQDLNVKLLEVNTRPAFTRKDKSKITFDKLLFELVDNNILNPLFGDGIIKPEQKSIKDTPLYIKP